MPEATTPPTPAEAASSATPAHRVGVVGIGASAGGLEALERFFDGMPADTGLAFVVVQHLSPDHKSLMVELLSKHTPMRVCRVEDEMAVEADTVYLLPPKKSVTLQGDLLRLEDRPPGHAVPLPIDIFFSSLAEARGEEAVGIVLSGTGSDGMRGVRDLKAAGGTVLVQDEASAKFDGMPRAAISTGIVDAVLPPEQMGARLRPLAHPEPPSLDPADEAVASAYGRIVDRLRSQAGHDFTHYKASSVLRRIERRMGVNAVPSLQAYADLVASSPEEVGILYRDLLIGVTRFFRDRDAYELVRTRVLPALLEKGRWDQQVRIWVAGCSTGEEAYSLGILLLEAMEAAGRRVPVKIFATDVDRRALEAASAGAYPASIAADVSPERLARYFVRRGDHYVVGRELRATVLFAAHNVVRDPPFTRVDLVTCRNLLIYLEPVLQRRALSLFHYALNQGRYLLLGPAESLGELADQFQVVDARWKLYQVQGPHRLSLGDALAHGEAVERRRERVSPGGDPAGPAEEVAGATRWLIGEFAPTALLVTQACELVHVFGDPARLLSVPTGKASLLVTEMLDRAVASAVSTAVHQAHQQQREIRYAGVGGGAGAARPPLDVRVVPLPAARAERPTLLVLLSESARAPGLPAGGQSLDAAAQERLADLEAELQYTKENLQATIEELETSNEELQATNEELLSSNEELQSTNEELQSVNEELHTVNQEYQAKIQELSELNGDLDNLLRGTDIGTLFLDEALRIRRYTPAVAGLVNVLPQDVGRSLEHFAFHFDAGGLLDDARAVIAGGPPRERRAAAHDGRRLLIRVLPYLGGATGRGAVITFIDVSATERERERLQAILDSLPHQMAVLDIRGRIALVNQAWRTFAEANGAAGSPGVGVGADYLAVTSATRGPERADAEAVAAGLRAVLEGRAGSFTFEYPCASPGEERWFLMTAVPLAAPFEGAVVSHVNVTRSRLAERALEEAGRG